VQMQKRKTNINWWWTSKI